jgi:hypothetical protein
VAVLNADNARTWRIYVSAIIFLLIPEIEFAKRRKPSSHCAFLWTILKRRKILYEII